MAAMFFVALSKSHHDHINSMSFVLAVSTSRVGLFFRGKLSFLNVGTWVGALMSRERAWKCISFTADDIQHKVNFIWFSTVGYSCAS